MKIFKAIWDILIALCCAITVLYIMQKPEISNKDVCMMVLVIGIWTTKSIDKH